MSGLYGLSRLLGGGHCDHWCPGFFINAVLVWPSLWGDFDLMDVLESSRGVVAVRAPRIWLIPSRMYRPSTDKFWTSIRPQSLPVGSQALILENKALLNICDVFT